MPAKTFLTTTDLSTCLLQRVLALIMSSMVHAITDDVLGPNVRQVILGTAAPMSTSMNILAFSILTTAELDPVLQALTFWTANST